MGFDGLFGAGGISSSGMSAERLRMEVIANNIANAQTTRSPNGGPYRRQDVVFETVLGNHKQGGQGVRAAEIIDDPSELPKIFNPGHPDADADGFLTLPNVQIPVEMVNLMTATRAYEANLKAALAMKQMNEQALTLMRS
jgi:flagellar basal-body rod protein FlgC